ncbi:glutathione S-transferase family protein [Phenylobacterium sp.]|uniref:glutathione S-transferase family protein n=1 Tax=Phenylobacterium sp. TaxID=1871053 RepID=UPI0012217022|nr:glutathione S-transferase family protein [Phenylobacterium sp.]THD63673.1 MAG: glutathione S-transferase family protein [Phenylobacterium sp.]
MILIGQYDSPFVRRVAIALATYGLAFEHRPWSVFGDVEKIAKLNPLRRVPTLVLDGGEVVTDSLTILLAVDQLVGPQRASLARGGDDGRELQRLSAFAAGVAEKAVSLVYERELRDEAFPLWVERCRAQVGETLDLLEAMREARSSVYLFDDALSHADVILAAAIRFVREALSAEFGWSGWPALIAHSDLCEALPAFREMSQPFKLATPDGAA